MNQPYCLTSVLRIKNEIMKRIAILLIAITISIIGISQNENRLKTHGEVKKYIDESIFPELEKQQINYLSQLSESETKELESIKGEMTSRKEEYRRNHQNNRGANHKKGNKRKDTAKSGQPNCRSEITSITEQHKDLNTSYKEFIEANRQQWMDDISKLHENMDIQPRKNKDGKTGMDMFFTRISNPDWLLLWDSSDSIIKNPRSMRNHNGKKSSKNTDRVSYNSEFRSDVKKYASENIIPVITRERDEFNNYLSNDEKEVIETARQKIQVRKIMFKNWYESEEFVPGKRANDPNFDSMREDMKSTMKEVDAIAVAHSDEIQTRLSTFKSQSTEWKEDIIDIAVSYGMDSEKMKNMGRHNKVVPSTPIQFLLFDSTITNEFDDEIGNVRVVIYPVPIKNNAVISLTGAEDQLVVITLFTKDGANLKELYNSRNSEEKLEVKFDTDNMKSGIYIVKVTTENSEIVRKIVVDK